MRPFQDMPGRLPDLGLTAFKDLPGASRRTIR
jgi:hypothetical protein